MYISIPMHTVRAGNFKRDMGLCSGWKGDKGRSLNPNYGAKEDDDDISG
jgi:hypothetical protein